TRMQPIARTTMQSVVGALNVALLLGVLIGAALLARANLRAKRADRPSADRLAIGLTLLAWVGWSLSAHHVSKADVQLRQMLQAMGFATFLGVIVWLLYLGIEPYARRFWPDGLLGWTRLLSGHVRDTRVGRDVLIGLVFAAVTISLE